MTNFQRFRLLRWALVLCGATVMLTVAGIAFGQTFALQPASNSQSALDPPKGNRLISLDEMNLSGIDGTTIRYRRNWPLSFIDGCVKTVGRANDKWTLLVCSGDVTYPTAESNLREWEALIAELGHKYASDLTPWGVSCSGVTPKGTSEERHWSTITPAIEAADKRLINAWAQNFPGKKLLFAIGNKDDSGMKRLITYAMQRAPGRVVVKHNAMKADTNINANHNQLVIWAGKQGAEIGFEMVGSTLESRFGGTYKQMMAKVAQVEKLAGKKVSYLAPYKPDLAKVGTKQ